MANGTNGVNSLWKYVATVAVTVLVAGSPGIIYALRTWNLGSEVKVLRERQDADRIRLALLEQQVMAQHDQLLDLQLQLRQLQQRR